MLPGESSANRANASVGRGGSNYSRSSRRSVQPTYNPPSYSNGPVRSVGGPSYNQQAAARANYEKRLASYTSARNAYLNRINQQAALINKKYQGSVNSGKQAYSKGTAGANKDYQTGLSQLTNDFNLSKSQMQNTYNSGIASLGQDYANRGINKSSGIFQQGLLDYQNGFNDRSKSAEDDFKKQQGLLGQGKSDALGKLGNTYKNNLNGAAQRRSAGLSGIANKRKAYDKSHSRPTL